MTLSQAISYRITELCKTKKYTSTRQMADKAGLSEGTIRWILKGYTKKPSVDTVYYICLALNIPLSQFFDSKLFDPENIDDN